VLGINIMIIYILKLTILHELLPYPDHNLCILIKIFIQDSYLIVGKISRL
jgi:hypothetical protein